MKIAVLLRNDLRLHDNPALAQASLDGQVLPMYVLEEGLGAAFKYWTHQNLNMLSASLRVLGGVLHYSNQPLPITIQELLKNGDIDAVYFNRSYHPEHLHRDNEMAARLLEEGIKVRIFEGNLLLPPGESLKENGEPYQVFTPFYKSFRTKSVPPVVPRVKEAEFIQAPKKTQSISTDIELLQLVSDTNEFNRVDKEWSPGEEEAITRFQRFIDEDVPAYKTLRDFPSIAGTSRISPYLAVGALSIRSVYHFAVKMNPDVSEAFIRQLLWREFAYQMLVNFPETIQEPLNKKFSRFPWMNNEEHFTKWCVGQTGVPLIDAGIREMLGTGYMHNRLRMNTASYLTKHLLVDFTKGMSFFWDRLIDADIALNTFGWQWSAGSGADASPYFRIFNPYLQSRKFDEEAAYIRKWVPELRSLSNKDIIEPDKASPEALEEAGIILGETYPFPIVPHKAGRERALLAYDEIKNTEGNSIRSNK